MGTISGMGFAQALVHTVHSTCACAKPIPEIVPMLKLDIPSQRHSSTMEGTDIFCSKLFQKIRIVEKVKRMKTKMLTFTKQQSYFS